VYSTAEVKTVRRKKERMLLAFKYTSGSGWHRRFRTLPPEGCVPSTFEQ
jgi:hypothetical protein